MSEISVTIESDDHGFIERECPHCRLQFKCLAGVMKTVAEEGDHIDYTCPYCHQTAPPNAWWTSEQVEYATNLAQHQMVSSLLDQFSRDVQKGNTGGGPIRLQMEMHVEGMPDEPRLKEAHNLVAMDLPCHPDCPIEVDAMWTQEIACPLCGTRYPAPGMA